MTLYAANLALCIRLLRLALQHVTEGGLPDEITRLVLLATSLLGDDDEDARLVAELVNDRGLLSLTGLQHLHEYAAGCGPESPADLWQRLAETESQAASDEAVYHLLGDDA